MYFIIFLDRRLKQIRLLIDEQKKTNLEIEESSLTQKIDDIYSMMMRRIPIVVGRRLSMLKVYIEYRYDLSLLFS